MEDLFGVDFQVSAAFFFMQAPINRGEISCGKKVKKATNQGKYMAPFQLSK